MTIKASETTGGEKKNRESRVRLSSRAVASAAIMPNTAATSIGGIYTPPTASSCGTGVVTKIVKPSSKALFLPTCPIDAADIRLEIDQRLRQAAIGIKQSIEIFRLFVAEMTDRRGAQYRFDPRFQLL